MYLSWGLWHGVRIFVTRTHQEPICLCIPRPVPSHSTCRHGKVKDWPIFDANSDDHRQAFKFLPPTQPNQSTAMIVALQLKDLKLWLLFVKCFLQPNGMCSQPQSMLRLLTKTNHNQLNGSLNSHSTTLAKSLSFRAPTISSVYENKHLACLFKIGTHWSD